MYGLQKQTKKQVHKGYMWGYELIRMNGHEPTTIVWDTTKNRDSINRASPVQPRPKEILFLERHQSLNLSIEQVLYSPDLKRFYSQKDISHLTCLACFASYCCISSCVNSAVSLLYSTCFEYLKPQNKRQIIAALLSNIHLFRFHVSSLAFSHQ